MSEMFSMEKAIERWGFWSLIHLVMAFCLFVSGLYGLYALHKMETYHSQLVETDQKYLKSTLPMRYMIHLRNQNMNERMMVKGVIGVTKNMLIVFAATGGLMVLNAFFWPRAGKIQRERDALRAELQLLKSAGQDPPVS